MPAHGIGIGPGVQVQPGEEVEMEDGRGEEFGRVLAIPVTKEQGRVRLGGSGEVSADGGRWLSWLLTPH